MLEISVRMCSGCAHLRVKSPAGSSFRLTVLVYSLGLLICEKFQV